MVVPDVFLQSGVSSLLNSINSVIQSLGVSVLLPIIIFLIALAFRVDVLKAARSSILIGIGFIGINLVIGLFSENISPLAQQMVEVTGITLPAVDVGWPAAAAIAFGIAELGVWMIPLFVVMNLVLFAIGFTYTLNVDIWNYWHFAFIGGLVYMSTNNWLYSVAVGLTLGLFVLVAADWTQPAVEETFDTPGISIPHGTSAPYAVAAIPIHWAVDKTPLGNIEADPDAIQDRFGILGEPIFVGLAIGLVIGIAAYSNALFVAESWYAILTAGISFAAVMHILPMMVGILMEGLTPLSESIRNYMTSRFEDRDMAIGLDSAILIGHESVIASSLLIVPIAIVMSIILPGNDVLWGIDLATFPFFFALMVPIMNGNIVKMVVTGTILLIPLHYISSAVAPLLTQAAGSAGFDLGGRGLITSPVADAGSPATGILALIPAPVALAVGLVIVLGIWVALRMWPQRMYMVAGASEEKARETVERRHTGKGGGLLPNKLGSTVDTAGAENRSDD
ncbi:Galactitol permease IIC component [Haloferax massiliensis]|uniref:Galactitol permease IIC component n=1 Tax=Haloferax massiliensis TaxID=1476858 RepID=A0A0D6JM54_9EURY|nr:Galactitol permease IIC component [Haloferax massiliensis]